MAHTNEFSLVIPVRNGGDLFVSSIQTVMRQTLKPSEIIIYDTESSDGSPERIKPLIKGIPLRIFPVRREAFDHGGTRNAALKQVKHPWVLFLTQDAVCANETTFAQMMSATGLKDAVAVYGRQLPHENATPLALTARSFNYGEKRVLQNMAVAPQLGIKTWFCSNSFCAWKKSALVKAGGFAEKLILGEDMHAAARLIQGGGTVVYEPAAEVRHSHNYSALEEFRRYFDIGVFHKLHADLLFRAGNANSEGFRFILRQARALIAMRAWIDLVRMPFHIAAKLIGYKLGQKFTLLGRRLSKALSMHKSYWS